LDTKAPSPSQPQVPYKKQNQDFKKTMTASTTIFESDTLEGTRATASAHRKIELQSPADLTYLIANVSRAARAKIDTHLPPDAAPESGEDALRRRVEVLVEEYIRKTFEGAKEGISVNGMGVGEMEEVLKRVGEGEGEFSWRFMRFMRMLCVLILFGCRNRTLRRQTRATRAGPFGADREPDSTTREFATRCAGRDGEAV
jgi:hypothetical protein